MLRRLEVLRNHPMWVIAPALGSGHAWQPSRGLHSRYGANPEKKIATNSDCGVHRTIVGEAIREVKSATSVQFGGYQS